MEKAISALPALAFTSHSLSPFLPSRFPITLNLTLILLCSPPHIENISNTPAACNPHWLH